MSETFDTGSFFEMPERREVAARMAKSTESPIEIMFGLAFYAFMEDDWELIPQFKWHSYRIDWAVKRPDKPLIFVECDGSEFHTRPEHVARDRLRDRQIAEAGIKLFRFPGAQIYGNAEGCALRVYLEARR
jgi:very-short-patch-repair endonuclease